MRKSLKLEKTGLIPRFPQNKMVNGFLIILILMTAAIGLADGFIGMEILDKLKRIEKTQDYLEFNLKYSLDQF